MDAIDLIYAKQNEIFIRTDMLAQNAHCTNFNIWPFKFNYKAWSHSNSKHPWVDPNDHTNNTQKVERLHQEAKRELSYAHKTIKNVRLALHVYEFKHNENIKGIHQFAQRFREVTKILYFVTYS